MSCYLRVRSGKLTPTDAVCLLWIRAPRFHEDMLRGNDNGASGGGVQRGIAPLPRVWGTPPDFLFLPPRTLPRKCHQPRESMSCLGSLRIGVRERLHKKSVSP